MVAAGRTDPDLQPAIGRMHDRLRAVVLETWREFFPLPDDAPEVASSFYNVIPTFLFAVLDGLAYGKFIPSEHGDEDTENVLWLVHQLAGLLPALTGTPEPSSVFDAIAATSDTTPAPRPDAAATSEADSPRRTDP
jgi:hypothetical protein